MALENASHLKFVLTQADTGRPLTARWLTEHGVSAQLARHYVVNGWLEKLGHGFFMRKGDAPVLEKSLAVAMAHGHVGGKTALAWAGFRHNLYIEDRTVLYSHGKVKVAPWLVERFPLAARNRKLFGGGDAPAVETNADGVPVSEPERAVLEMLSDVPSHQGMEEAENLVEMLYGLRPDLMQSLLEDCTSVKTVRLFLMLARKAALPVLDELDLDRVHTGSASGYVVTTPGGTLKL